MVKQYVKASIKGVDLEKTRRSIESIQRFTAQWNSSIAAQTQLQNRHNIRSQRDLELFLGRLYDSESLQDQVLRELVHTR